MPRRTPHTDAQRVEFIPNYRPFVKPIPIPEAHICDSPAYGMCISAEWMPIIRGLFYVLDQPDVWDSEDPDEIFAVRQQVRELMSMGQCMCGYGGGSRVINKAVNTTINLQLQAIFAVDGLDGVAPERPDTYYDEDSGDNTAEAIQRKVALCWAVHDYCVTVIEDGIFNAIIPESAQLAATGVISFLWSPLVGILVYAAVDLVKEMIQVLAEDPDLVEAVACCMYAGLGGEAIDQPTFEGSLDDCGFTPLSDEDVVASVIRSTLSDNGNWLGFVATLGGYMDVTDLLSTCPCDGPVCMVDFTVFEGGFEPIQPNMAEWLDGQGWHHDIVVTYDHMINIDFTHTSAFSVEQIRLTFTNSEPIEDINVLTRTRMDDDTLVEVQDTVLSPGETVAILNYAISGAVERLHFRIEAEGFPENAIMAHLVKLEFLVGDCVLPDPP